MLRILLPCLLLLLLFTASAPPAQSACWVTKEWGLLSGVYAGDTCGEVNDPAKLPVITTGTACYDCAVYDFDLDKYDNVHDWRYGCYCHDYNCDQPCVGIGTPPPLTSCGKNNVGQCSGACPPGTACRAKVSGPGECICAASNLDCIGGWVDTCRSDCNVANCRGEYNCPDSAGFCGFTALPGDTLTGARESPG